MADTAVANEVSDSTAVGGGASSASPATAKKGQGARTKSSHPPTADMVNGAIKSLKERGGSSLQAIKKYLVTTYKIDVEKMSPFIKKYIKNSVASGALIQTKGKGASGSFKLAAETTAAKGKKKAVAAAPPRRPKAAVSPVKKVSTAIKKPSPKTTATQKKKTPTPAAASPQKKTKAASSKKKTTTPVTTSQETSSTASPSKLKSPSKAKKTTKVPTKKPKAPKPKKAKAAASGAGKQAKKPVAGSPKKK